uniref:DRBM domain-containing protein n=1 Tax=Steinernema glaseri TaxID=37863 RepID=A0A1I7YDE8_9BILA
MHLCIAICKEQPAALQVSTIRETIVKTMIQRTDQRSFYTINPSHNCDDDEEDRGYDPVLNSQAAFGGKDARKVWAFRITAAIVEEGEATGAVDKAKKTSNVTAVMERMFNAPLLCKIVRER